MPPETVPPESVPPESVPPETVPPESVPPGSVPPAVRRVGTDGLLLEPPTGSVHQLAHWLRGRAYASRLIEVVPAARTVLVQTEPGLADEVARSVGDFRARPDTPTDGRRVELSVRYDGSDLAAVCEALSLSREEFVRAHGDVEYRVEFFGFAPGLAFCSGLPESLRLPRRDSPRTKVPAGSLAIANEFSIVYPASSPGGWHLIGSYVGAPLWDLDEDPPNRLAIGDRVVFCAVD